MKHLLSFALLLASINVYACPSIHGTSINPNDEDSRLIAVSYTKLKLKKDFFTGNPVFKEHMFEDCKNATSLVHLIDKHDGTNYFAIATYEDSCDGGNTLGVLLNTQKNIIAEIGDSEITCYSK